MQGVCQETVRLRRGQLSAAEASTWGLQGSSPVTTCIYISKHTAKQALLADCHLVLVGSNKPRSASMRRSITQQFTQLTARQGSYPPATMCMHNSKSTSCASDHAYLALPSMLLCISFRKGRKILAVFLTQPCIVLI